MANFRQRLTQAAQRFRNAPQMMQPRDPNLQYSNILPFATNRETGEAQWAVPELARGLMEGFEAPRNVLQGRQGPMEGAMQTAGAFSGGGLMGGATPMGALGMGALRRQPSRIMEQEMMLDAAFPRPKLKIDKNRLKRLSEMTKKTGQQAVTPLGTIDPRRIRDMLRVTKDIGEQRRSPR